MEAEAVGGICRYGLGDIQRCQLDFPIPCAGGCVVGGGVEDSVGDGVGGDFFTMTVAENQDGWTGRLLRMRWND